MRRLLLAVTIAAARLGAAPELTISLRGVTEQQLEQGEPLAATVLVAAPAGRPGIIELAPPRGTWADALAIELAPARGGAVLARAQPISAPDYPAATLDEARVAGGMWIFSAEAMQRVVPGDYVVTAKLELPPGRGWSGVVAAEPRPLRIVSVAADPARRAARAHARAQIAVAAGRLEEAARLTDAVLAQSPDDLELLCLRADLALRGGNPIAARSCVNRAARQLTRAPAGPPPLVFQEVSARVAAATLQVAGTAAKPPDWTWPPTSVVSLPASERTERAAQPLAPSETPRPAITSPASVKPSVAQPPSAGLTLGALVAAVELDDGKIRADPAGQWAATATAKSWYGANNRPIKTTGAPDVPAAGDSIYAWSPGVKDSGNDWLEVTFAQPVRAIGVRARQNLSPGAIVKVEATASDGSTHLWWQGADSYQAPANREIAWFAVRVPATSYPVAKIKLTFNLAAVPGWKQIDAVQLVSAP